MKWFNKPKEAKWFYPGIITISTLIVLGIGILIGQTTLRSKANDHVFTYEELVGEVDVLKEELQTTKTDLTSAKDELSSAKDELKDTKDSWQQYEDMYVELKELQGSKETMIAEKEELDVQLESINGEIAVAEDQLENIKAGIVVAEKEPKKLSAGQFLVGPDLPPDRYKAVATTGSGNFVVYSESGELMVNTILGSSYGVEEYVFVASEGDFMELSTPTTFIPVE